MLLARGIALVLAPLLFDEQALLEGFLLDPDLLGIAGFVLVVLGAYAMIGTFGAPEALILAGAELLYHCVSLESGIDGLNFVFDASRTRTEMLAVILFWSSAILPLLTRASREHYRNTPIL